MEQFNVISILGADAQVLTPDTDVAQATRLALEVGTTGHDAFLVAAADTCMTTPSEDLMRQVYPDVPLRRPVPGTDSLISIDKARAVLGYEPEVTWRDRV